MDASLATPAHAWLPDYAGGSIVNLLASLTEALGATDRSVPPLSNRTVPALLKGRRRIVLLVVDGMGQAQLVGAAWRGALREHALGTLTSVFPSTTATAITSLMTGEPPSRHGLTGWHMHFPEIDVTGAVLPFQTRAAEQPMAQLGLDPAQIFDCPAVFDRVPVASFALGPERILDSEYNRAHTGCATRIGYGSAEHLFQALLNCLRIHSEACFVYAYFADFDSTAHRHGVASAQAQRVLQRFDDAFGAFLTAAAGLDATVVVTADHGFIDCPPERLIELDDHPVLQEALRLPLCGERRAAYCYVTPERAAEFEAYVTDRLAEAFWLFRSERLIEQGWFGPGPPHPRLQQRIGDYTLVAKDDWTVKDWLPGEQRHRQIGVHGGVSENEMIVPLLIAQP